MEASFAWDIMSRLLPACRVWVHFGGVNNAFYAWLNGRLLGYSQDSCCPAEFEVTTALQPGKNVLAVQVCCCVLSTETKCASWPAPACERSR